MHATATMTGVLLLAIFLMGWVIRREIRHQTAELVTTIEGQQRDAVARAYRSAMIHRVQTYAQPVRLPVPRKDG